MSARPMYCWNTNPLPRASDILSLRSIMRDKDKREASLRPVRFAVPVLLLLVCGWAFAQDAPQPQPAPTVPTQQKPVSPPAPAAPAKPTRIIPIDAQRHFREGAMFQRDGNTENAIAEYKEAIKEYPDYFEAHYNLGGVYLDTQGYAEAITEFRAAIGLRPDDANAHDNLGLALKHNRDFSGAIAEYQEAVRLNPKLASAQNNLANVLYTRRDFNGAIQHYRAAIALETKEKMSEQDRFNLASTHMNLGNVLDDAGRPDEAIAEYKEAVQLEPKDAKTRYNFSVVYQKKKDMPAAIAELRQAAKLAPDWPTPHIMLKNLLKDSDPKAALDECVIADGLTHDAKLHDECMELQKKAR